MLLPIEITPETRVSLAKSVLGTSSGVFSTIGGLFIGPGLLAIELFFGFELIALTCCVAFIGNKRKGSCLPLETSFLLESGSIGGISPVIAICGTKGELEATGEGAGELEATGEGAGELVTGGGDDEQLASPREAIAMNRESFFIKNLLLKNKARTLLLGNFSADFQKYQLCSRFWLTFRNIRLNLNTSLSLRLYLETKVKFKIIN